MRRAAGIIASDSKIRTTSVLAIRNRSNWRRFAATAGRYQVPGLDHGPTANLVLLLVSSMLPVVVAFQIYPMMSSTIVSRMVFGLLLFAAWIGSIFSVEWLLRPFASRLPDYLVTAGVLAETMSALNYARLARECGGKTDCITRTPRQSADLRTAIFRVLGVTIGIDPEFIREKRHLPISHLIDANDGLRTGVQ